MQKWSTQGILENLNALDNVDMEKEQYEHNSFHVCHTLFAYISINIWNKLSEFEVS